MQDTSGVDHSSGLSHPLDDAGSMVSGLGQEEPTDTHNPSTNRETHNFTLGGKIYKRKKRKPLDKEKKRRLEEAFLRKEVPKGRHGSVAKKRLAEELGLSVKEVHKWFDNRRTKETLLEKRLFNQVTGGLKASTTPERKLNNASTIESISSLTSSNKRRKPGASLPALWDAQLPSTLKPAESDVTSHFRIINRFFEGKFDLSVDTVYQQLEAVSRDSRHHHLLQGGDSKRDVSTTSPEQNIMIDHEQGLLQRIQNRKKRPKVLPTLQNVLDVALSRESCFFPLVEAVETISARGYLDTLIRRILHEPAKSFRTFLMWYIIGKHSGERTVAAVIRSFMSGLAPAIGKISLADILESQLPELIDGGVDTASPNIDGKYVLFANDRSQGYNSQHENSERKWQSDFLNRLFLGKTFQMNKGEVVSLQIGEQGRPIIGEVTKVLGPNPRYTNEPRFRVYFAELDIALTINWKKLKEVMPSFSTGEKISTHELSTAI